MSKKSTPQNTVQPLENKIKLYSKTNKLANASLSGRFIVETPSSRFIYHIVKTCEDTLLI